MFKAWRSSVQDAGHGARTSLMFSCARLGQHDETVNDISTSNTCVLRCLHACIVLVAAWSRREHAHVLADGMGAAAPCGQRHAASSIQPHAAFITTIRQRPASAACCQICHQSCACVLFYVDRIKGRH